jgi:hypothetical protein
MTERLPLFPFRDPGVTIPQSRTHIFRGARRDPSPVPFRNPPRECCSMLRRFVAASGVSRVLAALLALGSLTGMGLAAPLAAQNTLVVEGVPRYEPTPYPRPDRAHACRRSVAFPGGFLAHRRLGGAGRGPDRPGRGIAGAAPVGPHGRRLDAPLEAENGLAHHHGVTFTGLRPGTLYAYRVGGGDTWSEWFQFRTASPPPSSPSRFSTSAMRRTR